MDSTIFGTGFVSPEGYDHLKNIAKTGTEDLTYAFILNGVMSTDDFKQMIKDFEFDYRSVDDPYYLELLEDSYGKKDEIRDGISELVDGARELNEGAGELYDGAGELYDGTKELEDGLGQIADGSEKLYDGVKGLKKSLSVIPGPADGVKPLVSGMSDLNDAVHEAYEGSGE